MLFCATDEGTFEISHLPLKKVEEQDDACWTPLFRAAVIAHEFPTPVRGLETGIELPFHLMSTLAGPLYPMNFDGGIYLKGSSRLLFPTAIAENGSIQWHLVSSREVGYTIPSNAIHQQKWVKIRSPLQLAQARTFLGYCRQIVIDLGTEKSTEYYRNILFSGLQDEQHAPAIGMPSTITAGTGGLPFNVGMTIPIVRTKAILAPQSVGIERDYMDVLDDAKNRPVIIYDTDHGSARGWMVPALCLILHMIHTWSAKFESFSEGFPHADLTPNAGDAARDVLLEKWNFVLRRTLDPNMQKDKLVKDLVMQYWDGIVQRRYHDLEALSQAAYQHELAPEKLYGWDYMDVVVGKHSRRQQSEFETNWGHFSEDCIVIFGKTLGDLIRPAPGVKICSKWDPIRSKKMFLTAPISCLQMLAYERGGSSEHLTSARLTNKGYWHYKPKELFADCRDCDRQRCRKVPQYLQQNARQDGAELIPPSDGAVVFGNHCRKLEKPLSRRKSAGAPRAASQGHNIWAFLAKLKFSTRRRVKRGGSGTLASSSLAQSDSSLNEESDEQE